METKEQLRQRPIKELKELLRQEGYNPDDIVGVEKDELVTKLWVLRQNPVEEDPFPLPLYSNCWQQFVLRALLLLGVQWFLLSFFVAAHINLLIQLAVTALLGVRNWLAVRQ
ncbi:unnamed protein product [Effrenium voratum]|nr:unnamed protein product [Effrenium voratum]